MATNMEYVDINKIPEDEMHVTSVEVNRRKYIKILQKHNSFKDFVNEAINEDLGEN